MNPRSETLFRRVQDPDYSDWKTIRVDELGKCIVLGKVYLSRPTVSGETEVVRLNGEHVATWRDADGRLFADESVSGSTLDMVVETATTGKSIKRGVGHLAIETTLIK